MANFDLAPPPKTVDGLLAVPIDITSVDATFVFDGAASAAVADATITYAVGPTAGNPIFDLRQTIDKAWLDGAPFPVPKLAHHAFGSGSFTDLRVIESVQAAGSVHTLRVQYSLALPDSQLAGYLPVLTWSPGPTLKFAFGLSDLNRARYAEAWLPANLIFDQFTIDLEFEIVNTLVAHSLITNGVAATLGTNHWQIAFPARFSAVSPLLEVRATDTLESATSTVSLPVSGKTVTIEAWKPVATGADLPTQINAIKGLLIANENDYGGYLHDERYVALFSTSGGMEYEGGTTTSSSALAHETFHSWFARGIKPASQADGWWDEGFTSWHDGGANDAIPLDFTQPPVVLCSRDPWQRHTPGNAYGDGSALFAGLASMLGVAQLNALMGDLYDEQKGKDPVSSARIEEFVLSRSGNAQVVSAFHRFVFGLGDPSPAPDLWLRDAPGDPGANAWGGAFWDSPDLWVRREPDGGTTHQPPEYGQDNWFYARVRNRGPGNATHFVVTFHSKGFAATQFQYPADFLPSVTAKAEFDLASGETRIVRARWPRPLVPPEGTHTCLIAAVLCRSDLPIAGRHVWEHNNLAQKNLTVVDLLPNTFMIIPVVISNWSGARWTAFELGLLDEHGEPVARPALDVSLIHPSRAFLRRSKTEVRPFRVATDVPAAIRGVRAPQGRPERPERSELLDCGGLAPSGSDRWGALLTSDRPDLVAGRFPDSWEAALPRAEAGWRVDLRPMSQTVVGLKMAAPGRASPGQSIKLHLVQRRRGTGQIVGGIAMQVNVRDRMGAAGGA